MIMKIECVTFIFDVAVLGLVKIEEDKTAFS